MKIERRFTQAGRDPYEGIRWVSRTSEIRNPDGSVVFRQEGVTVPSTWSSVAADVLAQKYFRRRGVPQTGPDGKPLVKDGKPVLGGEKDARQVFHRLMDAVDPTVVTSIEHIASQVAGVQRVGAVQARWVGHRLAASVAVVVDEDLTVRQGHDVAEAVRHDLLHALRHLDDVDVHVDPCGHHGIDRRCDPFRQPVLSD